MNEGNKRPVAGADPEDAANPAGGNEHALEAWLRPCVVVDLVPRRYINMLHFRVRNVGRCPAYRVRLALDKPVVILGKQASEFNIFNRAIPVLAPNDELAFFFGSAAELFNKEDAILQFGCRITYLGPEGTEYTDTIGIDVDLLRGLAIDLPQADDVLTKLERIGKSLDKIARYTEEVRRDRLSQRLRAAKAKELEAPPEDTDE